MTDIYHGIRADYELQAHAWALKHLTPTEHFDGYIASVMRYRERPVLGEPRFGALLEAADTHLCRVVEQDCLENGICLSHHAGRSNILLFSHYAMPDYETRLDRWTDKLIEACAQDVKVRFPLEVVDRAQVREFIDWNIAQAWDNKPSVLQII